MTRILSLLVCFVALAAGPARAQSQNAALSSRIAFFSPSRAIGFQRTEPGGRRLAVG